MVSKDLHAPYRPARRAHVASLGAVLWALAASFPAGVRGQATAVPAETCAAGVISSIDVDSRAIYDPASTSIAPLAWTYRTLNLLHINTSESFIRGELLFKEGDCFDPFLISESYRLIDSHGFMFVEEITEEDDGAGGHRVHVATRDEWSTKVDLGVNYEGGFNLERFQATEENLLGHGVFGEFTYYKRRETKTRSFGIRTPRFFGRSDAGVSGGVSRAGHFFEQYLRYPFVGEAGRIGVREGFNRTTDYFAYSTDGAEVFTQVLVPVRREQIEISGAYRFGEAGRSVILGAGISWDEVTFPRGPEIIFDDFDVRESLPGTPPGALDRQLRESAATRVSLHLGTRRFRYVEYTGLDDLRHTELVGLGLFAGASVGRTIGLLRQNGAPREDDVYTRGHVSFAVPLGLSLLSAGSTVEARHVTGGWRDILLEVDVAAYGRIGALPSHTLFLRASGSGGWDTTLPFQLSLGGREGVRSLAEDRYPGGRMLRFVIEDRVALPWPSDTADLGLTLFSDVGRVWPGDSPYGIDSDWQAALGFGLRIGLPRGTRHIYRTDIAFPIGRTGGSPIFRVTFEFNQLRAGFFTRDVRRSRRFQVGPDSF
jgi:hypothetical protein